MVYFEFWSHEKIEYRSHEIRPPDPESQLVIICSIAECSAAVRKLFPSKSYSNISWIFFMKCTLKNVLCQIWKLILKMKNLFPIFFDVECQDRIQLSNFKSDSFQCFWIHFLFSYRKMLKCFQPTNKGLGVKKTINLFYFLNSHFLFLDFVKVFWRKKKVAKTNTEMLNQKFCYEMFFKIL